MSDSHTEQAMSLTISEHILDSVNARWRGVPTRLVVHALVLAAIGLAETCGVRLEVKFR